MRNIYFKGNYVSDEQLIKRESIPDNATEFGIVSDLRSEMVRGFLMMLPLIVVMILLTYFKIKNVDYHLTMNIHLIAAFFALIISEKILRSTNLFITLSEKSTCRILRDKFNKKLKEITADKNKMGGLLYRVYEEYEKQNEGFPALQ